MDITLRIKQYTWAQGYVVYLLQTASNKTLHSFKDHCHDLCKNFNTYTHKNLPLKHLLFSSWTGGFHWDFCLCVQCTACKMILEKFVWSGYFIFIYLFILLSCFCCMLKNEWHFNIYRRYTTIQMFRVGEVFFFWF